MGVMAQEGGGVWMQLSNPLSLGYAAPIPASMVCFDLCLLNNRCSSEQANQGSWGLTKDKEQSFPCPVVSSGGNKLYWIKRISAGLPGQVRIVLWESLSYVICRYVLWHNNNAGNGRMRGQFSHLIFGQYPSIRIYEKTPYLLKSLSVIKMVL